MLKKAAVSAAVALLVIAASGTARAQGPHVVRPLEGLVCKKLNVTEREVMSPNGGGVGIRNEPSSASPVVQIASSVLYVRKPEHVVSGFVEVVRIDGKPGWIEQSRVKPFDPTARCVPSLMSNGLIGPG